jgi:hypothetical protein
MTKARFADVGRAPEYDTRIFKAWAKCLAGDPTPDRPMISRPVLFPTMIE